MLLLSFVIILPSLCSPNEDFGKPKSILDHLFGHYFKGVSTRFGLRLLENVLKTTVRMFSVLENLRLGAIKLLQKIVASQKTNTPHVATIFCNDLAKLLQKIVASQKTNKSHVATIFCKSSCKVVTKDRSIPENQHITCCYYLL